VYRHMDVGTAKPDARARSLATWHGLDLVEPHERFDASSWVEHAQGVLAGARERGHPVLVVGGTVLYLKALTEGLFENVPRDAAARAKIREEAASLGTPALHARLVSVDPRAAARIHPNDLRRIERALEVHSATGKTISELQGQFGTLRPGFERTVFFVERKREDLDRRIDRRVERMFAEGWLDEVRALAKRPQGISPEAEQALGYKDLLAHVRAGERDPIEGVLARIQTRTRRFARRQLNWLRHHVSGLRALEVPPGGEATLLHSRTVVSALRSDEP